MAWPPGLYSSLSSGSVSNTAIPSSALGSSSASGTPALWAVRLAAALEDTVLALDLWGFSFASGSGGSVAAAARGTFVPPSAPAVSGGGGVGGGVAPFFAIPLAPTGGAAIAGAAAGTLPSHIRCAPSPGTLVTWLLQGEPLAGIYGGLAASSATSSPSSPSLHTPMLPAALPGALSLTVPRGTLLPGFVYSARATLNLTCTWGFSGSDGAPPPAQWPGTASIPLLSTTTVTRGETFIVPLMQAWSSVLLWAHSPPFGGALALNTATGTAFSTLFSLSPVSAWQDADDLVAPPLSLTSAAAWANSSGSGSGAWDALAASASAGLPLSTALMMLNTGFSTVVCPPPSSSAVALPWQGLHAVLASALGTTPTAVCQSAAAALLGALRAGLAAGSGSGAVSSSLTPIISQRLFCDVGSAATANAAAAASSGSAPPSATAWPLGLTVSSSSASAATSTLQPLNAQGYLALLSLQKPLLAGTASLPGIAIAAPSSAPSAAVSNFPAFTLTTPVSLLSKNVPVTTAAPFLCGVQAVDALGGVGVAWARGTLLPLTSPGSSLQDTANLLLQNMPSSAGALASAVSVLTNAITSQAGVAQSAPSQASVAALQLSLAQSLASVAISSSPSQALDSSSATTVAAALATLTQPNSNSGTMPIVLSSIALSSVSSLLSAVNTSQVVDPTVAASLSTSALTIITNAVATSPVVPPPAPAALSGYVFSATSLTASASGGITPALKSNITATVSLISAVLAGSNALNATASVSSAPASASQRSATSVPSYCGGGASFAASPLHLLQQGSNIARTVALAAPLNPCYPEVPAPFSSRFKVPLSLVAAQPPPSVTLSPYLLASLASLLPPSAGGSVSLVQWGVPPHAECTQGLTFPALPAASDVELQTKQKSALALVNSGRRGGGGNAVRRLQSLIASSQDTMNAIVASVGGTTAPQATSSALLALSPRATIASDALPDRAMDSRTVTVTMGSLPQDTVLPVPYLVTLPLLNPGIIVWDSDRVVGYTIGQAGFATISYNLTCPTSPAGAARGIDYSLTGPPGFSSTSLGVRLVRVVAVSYLGVVGEQVESSALGGMGSVGLGGDGLSSGSASTSVPISYTPGSSDSTSATQPSQQYTYILSADCGPLFSAPQNFSCGVSMEGQPVTYACPVITPTPTCLWFDAQKGAWSTAGIELASMTPTAALCNTTRLGEHAFRLVALPAVQRDIFVASRPLTIVKLLAAYMASPIIFLVYLSFLGVAALGYSLGDRPPARAAFALALEEDAAVLELRARRQPGGGQSLTKKGWEELDGGSGTGAATAGSGGSAATAGSGGGPATAGSGSGARPWRLLEPGYGGGGASCGSRGRGARVAPGVPPPSSPSPSSLSPAAKAAAAASALPSTPTGSSSRSSRGGGGGGQDALPAQLYARALALAPPSLSHLVTSPLPELLYAWRQRRQRALPSLAAGHPGAEAEDSEAAAQAPPSLASLAHLALQRTLLHPPALLAPLWPLQVFHPALFPIAPAHARFTLAAASTLGGAYAAMLGTLFEFGDRSDPGRLALPPLPLPLRLALAGSAALGVGVVDALLQRAFTGVCAAQARGGMPALAREVQQRRAVGGGLLSPYSTPQLLRVLQEVEAGEEAAEAAEAAAAAGAQHCAASAAPAAADPGAAGVSTTGSSTGAAAQERGAPAAAPALPAPPSSALQLSEEEEASLLGGSGGGGQQQSAPSATSLLESARALLREREKAVAAAEAPSSLLASAATFPAFSLAATLLSLFCAFYLYSFATARGSAANADTLFAWGLGACAYVLLLRPAGVLLDLCLAFFALPEEAAVERALQGSLADTDAAAGAGEGAAAAPDTALLLCFRLLHVAPALAAGRARHGGRGKVEAKGLTATPQAAFSGLAPTSALVVAWQRGGSAHLTLRAALLERLYLELVTPSSTLNRMAEQQHSQQQHSQQQHSQQQHSQQQHSQQQQQQQQQQQLDLPAKEQQAAGAELALGAKPLAQPPGLGLDAAEGLSLDASPAAAAAAALPLEGRTVVMPKVQLPSLKGIQQKELEQQGHPAGGAPAPLQDSLDVAVAAGAGARAAAAADLTLRPPPSSSFGGGVGAHAAPGGFHAPLPLQPRPLAPLRPHPLSSLGSPGAGAHAAQGAFHAPQPLHLRPRAPLGPLPRSSFSQTAKSTLQLPAQPLLPRMGGGGT